MSNNGNLYFASYRNEGYDQSDIYCSKFIHGEYRKPESLASAINADTNEQIKTG